MNESSGKQQYVFSTERLRFREMIDADLDFIAEMISDPGVMRYYPKTLPRHEATQWLDRQKTRYRENGHGLWLVENRATGEPIGQVGVITQQVEEQPLIEVGYLIHQPFWKQGYAIEAATACKQYAFEKLGAEMVHSLIRTTNIPSQRVAIRNGMKPLRLVSFHDLDTILFGISREEYFDGQ